LRFGGLRWHSLFPSLWVIAFRMMVKKFSWLARKVRLTSG